MPFLNSGRLTLLAPGFTTASPPCIQSSTEILFKPVLRRLTVTQEPSQMSVARPLRIACLHGFRQNAHRLRQKTGALRKTLERSPQTSSSALTHPLVELIYLDAPFVMQTFPRTADLSNSDATSQRNTEETTLERAVFSPKVSASDNARDEADPPVDNNVADLTHRSWWSAEGRKYSGWEQSFDYLRGIFAEQVK